MSFDVNQLNTHQFPSFMTLLGQFVQDHEMDPENAEQAVDHLVALFEARVVQQPVDPEIVEAFYARAQNTQQIIDQHQVPPPILHHGFAHPNMFQATLEIKVTDYGPSRGA